MIANYSKTRHFHFTATAPAKSTVNSINVGDYTHNYQTPACLSNYMTSIASDDNSSIAFIDEDPPPYAVHCMSLPCPEILIAYLLNFPESLIIFQCHENLNTVFSLL